MTDLDKVAPTSTDKTSAKHIRDLSPNRKPERQYLPTTVFVLMVAAWGQVSANNASSTVRCAGVFWTKKQLKAGMQDIAEKDGGRLQKVSHVMWEIAYDRYWAEEHPVSPK